jgi:hypothetical protein
MTSQPEITHAEIRDALSRSGYLIESRVGVVLRRFGYFVELNASIADPDTNKSRELDIHAIRARQCGGHRFDFIFPILLVECVNNPQPIVFFTTPPEVPSLRTDAIAVSGLPVKVWPNTEPWNRATDLRTYVDFGKWHHYCLGRVATQFCSFARKGGASGREWMALHEGPHFDAFKKLGDAVDHFKEEHIGSWIIASHEHINLQIYYPILVVQGNLLELRSGRANSSVRPVKHVRFRRSVSSHSAARYYQIDVVHEKALPQLLRVIQQEIERLARLLSRRAPTVQGAVDRIAARARRARSSAGIRDAMNVSRQ